MTTSKPTGSFNNLGPWKVFEESLHGFVTNISVWPEDGVTSICEITDDELSSMRAIAHLISASPDLLEAAKLALDDAELSKDISSECYDKLEKAIAKAEGR